ncbi:MAG: hypothetical protein KDC92_06565 [Bacteroidetes bacterium]|nr:hypothetical protein [Bacteroidota bacterium]
MKHFVIFITLVAVLAGCDKKQKHVNNSSEFEKIDGINAKTQRVLVYNPAIVEGRVDSMKMVVELLEKANINNMSDKPELLSAYNLYKSSLLIFEEYVLSHDAIMFNSQQYEAEIRAFQEQENVSQKEIEDLTLKVHQNYRNATELMSKYLGVVRQYYRKKELVERLYLNLQNLS